MGVAKSYQNYEIVKKPYENNNKFYVDIDFKGKIKTVRWYEEPMKKIRPRKDALGFTKGYIHLVKGNSYDFKEWLFEHGATYRTFWGWSFASDVELPENLPAGLSLVRLDWDKVAYVDEDELKSQSAINDAVAEIMYDPSPSRWQGEVGDRIDRTLTVTKVTELTDGYFGPSTFYLFTDGENEYTWTTAAKKLDLGSTWQVRGTIKALQKYKGKEQTVLTRCRVE